ncbi:Alba [Novymonas esmeraldas]|uniref:Alba n=1 Tax=Novymonas esmeraldas TaxID=1808958 RepID=A0AAW0EUJ9_9TRYP
MPPRPSREEFRRVRENREARERPEGAENEVRVTATHGQHSYISYAIAVLNGEDGKTRNDTVKISGMGGAIYNAVNIAEIVKHRIAGLHQITELGSELVRDEYEPIDRSVNPDNVVVERKVSTILITLSRDQLDRSNPGYQEPIPESEVTEQEKRDPNMGRRGGRGGGRGAGRGGSRGGRGGSRGGRGGGRGGRGGFDRRDDRDDREE